MLIGYARVSTYEQNLDLQIDALQKDGCEKIFTDKASGAKDDRPGLAEAIEFLRKGDTLVVWKLDRLGRSLRHLIEVVNEFHKRGRLFKSLQENIDTASSSGKLIFHVFGALAEFERDVIRERTLAGLQAARERGRVGGRPKSLDDKQVAMARSLLEQNEHGIDEVCNALGVSRSTLYRYLEKGT
ncbi:recombinase family protein [Candidatus Neomarinimicrobiota bacterium]